jgi:hypothetical protein
MMTERSPGVSIITEVRPAGPNDIEALVVMCGEHAQYEGAPYRRAGKARALSQALFAATPRASTAVSARWKNPGGDFSCRWRESR